VTARAKPDPEAVLAETVFSGGLVAGHAEKLWVVPPGGSLL
jgi:hypothetical protein